ncbi:hypothetical protein B0I35DRAFT_418201 [Stachybotrys elegans]|uniref:Zinc finger PHD-type domain-containing protein n=1 Tax=Stachybotrys elegans TaxID=80388 RepID=A0A8K0WWJ9_9HYPO|nr:hypothetical protein B0I35DRAFT_418201 [Stachybotrys elegans]
MAGPVAQEHRKSTDEEDRHDRASTVATPGMLPAEQASFTANARLPYVPQFSTTTSFILSRMKSGNGDISSAVSSLSEAGIETSEDAFQDAKKRLVQSMQTSMTMPISPSTAGGPSLSRVYFASGSRSLTLNIGEKRKRDSGSDKVDFSQNTISFPTPPRPAVKASAVATQSPPVSTRTGTQARCWACEGTTFATGNALLTCRQCLGSWHQQCASPAPSSGSNMMENGMSNSIFVCVDCKAFAGRRGVPAQDEERRQRMEKMRQKRLSRLPEGVAPAKPELVGFGAGSSSDKARVEYFHGKKKTDLLNILSFCDQLKPQLLVDLLVSVSKKHPELPMFESPDWEASLPSKVRSQASAGPGGSQVGDRPRQQAQPPSQRIKQKVKTHKKTMKIPRNTEPQANGLLDVEDPLPPTWHKAGEGLYARLVPENEDRSFLTDCNDEEAFSQFMVDRMGRQVVEPL